MNHLKPAHGGSYRRVKYARGLCLHALLASTALASPALADAVSTTPPPVAERVDRNGVDVVSGQYTALNPNFQIGDDANGLGAARNILGATYTDSLISYVQDQTTSATIVLEGGSIKFNGSAGTYSPVEQNGNVLTKDSGGYTLTKADGTVYRFSGQNYNTAHFGTIYGVPLTSVSYPSGKKLNYYYSAATVPSGADAGSSGLRLQAVVSNSGYQIHVTYAHPDLQNKDQESSWSDAILVIGLNNLMDPCDPNAAQCSNTAGYPDFATSTATQTQKLYEDAAGNQTRFQLDSAGRVIGVAPPASINNAVLTYSGYFNGHSAVSSITNARGTTNYQYTVSGNIGTVTATNGSTSQTYQVDLTSNRILQVTDELGRTTSYEYNGLQQLDKVTYPKGNYDTLEYDARGNLTRLTKHPKAGSALGSIVSTAAYPATCTNPVTCNKPSSTTDGNGYTTDYSYDPVHGGVVSVTGPAPTAGGVRPQARYSYAQLDATGAASSSGIFVVSKISTCATAASCAGTSDEMTTSYSYGQNLLVSSVTTAAGDNSVSSTTAMAYDKVGNVVAADGPLAGSADTSYFKYDRNRRLLATVSPDPDGAGPLKYRASRTTYSVRNLLAKEEIGTVTDPSDAAVANMTVLRTVDSAYDYYGRKVSETLSSGGVAYAVTSYSYDALSQLNCSAVRMNPASFSSLPSDACSAAPAGTYGADRISQVTYTAAGEVKSVTTAVGTANAQTTSFTYNLNGDVQTITDPKGNVSNYVYDDLVRLYQLHYPDPTTGAASASDFEQYGYDSNGNVTTRKLRNNVTLNYSYDALDRLVKKTASSGANTVTYQYDLMSHLTQGVSQTTAHTVVTNWNYDGLGRKVSDVSLLDGASAGSKSMQYDAAGRRIRLTWGDGFYITYDYDNADEMTGIRENGGALIESFGYDDFGHRTSHTAANGTSVAYGFDTVSRLTSLSLNGGSSPTSITIGGYNPDGQIGTRSNTNDGYAWAGASNGAHNYSINRQNQISAIDGVTQAYDPKGNKTSQDGQSFTYNIENMMSSGGASNFLYDALNRLVYSSGSGRFDYDGDQLISENDVTGNLLRRYVFGPSVDEPLVWYEGAGVGARRYLDADERGSIIRVTDGTGATLAVNTYGEYGEPGPANMGRFQYTGQAWMPEVSLYNYKARMYSPKLGRFMQPDPAGYEAGTNLYNYVDADPVNNIDPSGEVAGVDDIVVIGTLTHVSPIVIGAVGTAAAVIGDLGHAVGHLFHSLFGHSHHPPKLEGHSSTTPPAVASHPFSLPVSGDADEIVVTGTKMIPDSVKWVLVEGRYYLNPHYTKPWYDDYVAYGFVLGPPAVGLAAAAAPEAISVEGADAGYRYGGGRLGQIRFFKNKLILRLDVRSPWTHVNVQGRWFGRPFNFHIPPKP